MGSSSAFKLKELYSLTPHAIFNASLTNFREEKAKTVKSFLKVHPGAVLALSLLFGITLFLKKTSR